MSGKFALIIGNTEYIDPGLAQLTAPGKDAEDFARILKDKEIGAFDDVKVIVNEPSASVIESIDEFFDQKKPDDLLVLYFSGHGMRDEIGSLYLAFKNTIRTRLRATAIKADYIRESMDQSRSKRQVLILDCCNSGAFPPGTKAELGGAMGMIKAFQGYGRFVLTASDATQFAWEGNQVIGTATDNSLFTHFLVKGLEGEADDNGDGQITVDELYDYAYYQISQITPKQTPTKSASKQAGEIVLRENMRMEDIKPVALPEDLMSEIEDIRPAVREWAVQRLEKILRGKNIGMARSAVEALEKIAADENTTRRVYQIATQILESYRQVEKKAEEERRAREEAERLAELKAEEERLAREKAEAERKAKEEAEKLARAKAEREAAEHEAARLKAEREAAELAAHQAAEKAAKEKSEKEAAEHEAVKKAEREAMELASRKKEERKAAEKAEREAMQLAAQKKAEREAKEKVSVTKGKPVKISWITPVTIGIVFIALVLCGFALRNYLPGIFSPPATESPTESTIAATEVPAMTETLATTQGVAREDTVILGWSISSPIGVTNPWAVPGYTHQEGNAFMWEPLMYFAIFANREIPWLADSMEYNSDFTQLTIKLNQDAAWSDGTPVTSRDVAFTFEGQLTNDKLPYHTSFEQFVDSVATPDDKTVVVTFKIPAPRFAFEVLMLKFDTGIPIVPAHVLENESDMNAFVGGLDMVHSGPYNLVLWDSNQKIYELREDWWAVKAGRIAMPQVKRIVIINIGGENINSVVQRLINNEFDAILDVSSDVVKQALNSNDKITTHTGNKPPYGYFDWWPNSLWMNTQIEPFSDVRVRRAISLSINRDQIDELLYDGAKVTTIYPFPLYPGLRKFVDSPAVMALEDQYQPRKFDLDESASLMYEAGFTKNGDGLWERDGTTVPAVINGFEGIHADIVTILVELLRAGGFDASINFGSDAYNNMIDGKPGLYMFGHGASLKDPYAAFELFRDTSLACTTACYNRFSRYSNPEYDAILDQMAPLSSDDPVFQDLAAQALGIYWRDQIDVPIMEWLHRIPYNQTYWTNWPTADNLAMGTNGAFWQHTGLLVITGLEKAK